MLSAGHFFPARMQSINLVIISGFVTISAPFLILFLFIYTAYMRGSMARVPRPRNPVRTKSAAKPKPCKSEPKPMRKPKSPAGSPAKRSSSASKSPLGPSHNSRKSPLGLSQKSVKSSSRLSQKSGKSPASHRGGTEATIRTKIK